MPFFAEIVNGIVTQVIKVASSDCANGILPNADIVGGLFVANLGLSGVWKFSEETDGKQRYNTAGISYSYDAGRDAFIAPKPYPSWLLDEATCTWEPPFPCPIDDKEYDWDESILNWIEIGVTHYVR